VVALRRERLLVWLAGFSALVLLAILVSRGLLREVPGTNSYGALAEALLQGRLWVERCPEIDCAVFAGRTYIIFPPFPALVALPFVAFVGFAAFKGFVFLGLGAGALSLLIWSHILRSLGAERVDRLWILLALAFASPLYQVTLRADGVWFFAQAVGFLMASLSLWAVVCRSSLPLAAFFVALAFLCRQMSIFYPLFLLALVLRSEESLVATARRLWKPVSLAAVPVLAALALIFIYNWARFGHPLDTGYSYIHNPGIESFIGKRISDIGLFSRDYLIFNVIYLFLQGPHFEFGAPHLVKLSGFDKAGVALLISSPWLLLAFYARLDRVFLAGATVIALIAGITLFYHSNGADQINAQRYTLDWLPILLVLMMRGERPQAFAALPLLVTAGVVMNTAITVLLAFYRL